MAGSIEAEGVVEDAERERQHTIDRDDAQLQALGIKPQLNRTLGFLANFALAFSFISVTTGTCHRGSASDSTGSARAATRAHAQTRCRDAALLFRNVAATRPAAARSTVAFMTESARRSQVEEL